MNKNLRSECRVYALSCRKSTKCRNWWSIL